MDLFACIREGRDCDRMVYPSDLNRILIRSVKKPSLSLLYKSRFWRYHSSTIKKEDGLT